MNGTRVVVELDVPDSEHDDGFDRPKPAEGCGAAVPLTSVPDQLSRLANRASDTHAHMPNLTPRMAVATTDTGTRDRAPTTIFSVVEAVLLRPLPYPDADRIVRIFEPSAEGRTLRRDDECAVVLNEALARSGFLGPRALGRRVFVAGHPDPSESWASCARCGYI